MTHYNEDETGVTVHFDRGQPSVHAKVLVGADGYFSRIRKQCLNDGPPLFAVGNSNNSWRGAWWICVLHPVTCTLHHCRFMSNLCTEPPDASRSLSGPVGTDQPNMLCKGQGDT